MFSIKRLVPFFSVVLVVLFTCPLLASARTTNDEDDYDDYEYGKTRVARVNLIRGDVQLRRADSRDWERVTLNLPLVEGDQLATGNDSRIEIQLDGYNFIRLDQNSYLSIVTLRDEGIAISIAEGTVSVRLARFDKDKEYFEIDAPKTTIAAEKKGLYRVDAPRDNNRNGEIVVAVAGGGQARVYSDTAGFTIRNERVAKIYLQDGEVNDWDFTNVSYARDDWDRWIEEREDYLAKRYRYDRYDKYYDSNLYGAEDLDSYGDWYYASQYGYIWRPRHTSINIYSNWVPYRHGHWRWCPPFGWTWIPDEPWGWATYHYGRWVFYNGYWCWVPTNYYGYHRRSWWYPSLVTFVYVPTYYGQQICWYPRPYQQPAVQPIAQNKPRVSPTPVGMPRKMPDDPNTKPADDNLRDRKPRQTPPLGSGQDNTAGKKDGGGSGPLDVLNNGRKLSELPVEVKEQYIKAISGVQADKFGKGGATISTPPLDVARRVVTAEPVMGKLPVQPSNTNSDVTVAKDRVIVKEERPNVQGAKTSPMEIRTGAAQRKPGISLDEELKNDRVYKGREPVGPPTKTDVGVGNGGVPNTGAVKRPDNPVQPATQPSNADNKGERPIERRPRQGLPAQTTPPNNSGNKSDSGNNEQKPPVYTPQTKPRQEPTKQDPPRYDPPPRIDPPKRDTPPPRYDPPPRNDPPVRNDPPPRSEPKQSPPPQKSEPPPQKQDSPKKPDKPDNE